MFWFWVCILDFGFFLHMFLLVIDLVGGLYLFWYKVMFFWVFFGRYCLSFGVYLCWFGGVYLLFYYCFFDAFFFYCFFGVFCFVLFHNNFCIFYFYLVLAHLLQICIFLLY